MRYYSCSDFLVPTAPRQYEINASLVMALLPRPKLTELMSLWRCLNKDKEYT